MKKTIKVLLIVFTMILVAGCSDNKREEINKNKFITIANNSGYKVVENTQNYDYAENAFYYKSDITYIFFITGKELNIISSLYVDEVNNYAAEAGEDAKPTTKKGDNYSVYMTSDKDYYYFVGRVGKTFIKAKTKLGSKNKLVKFLKEIGYY